MRPRRYVYLDNAATTPVDPQVAALMQECLGPQGACGNPASISHAAGRGAARLIEQARAQVAALIGAQPAQIIFTSGATEADNLAVLGFARANAHRGRHLVSARTEHKAVLDALQQLVREGFTLSWLTPGQDGAVSAAAVAQALRPDTLLVTLMHVNNETGVVQDIAAIGEACRARGVSFHTDAVQSAGRLPLQLAQLPVDLLSLSAHKLHGPKGIGALYVREALQTPLQPLLFGGGQERGLRPGTLPTHQIAGFGLACELAAAARAAEYVRVAGLGEQLWQQLAGLGGVQINGGAAARVPHILNVSFEDLDGESLLMALPQLAVSSGSACNSAQNEPSYVLRALGRSARQAESALRFSFGRFTTAADIDAAATDVRRAVLRLRSLSPARGAGHAPADPSTGVPTHPLTPADGARAVCGAGAEVADPAADPGADPAADPGADPAGDPALDALSPQVRELFRRLPGAGEIGDEAGTVLRGEAGSAAAETWVRFHLLVGDDSVMAARFQARGCPHTLATAAWLTERLPGRPRRDAVPDSPLQWARTLAVPVEKLGRLLLVEDALRTALLRWP